MSFYISNLHRQIPGAGRRWVAANDQRVIDINFLAKSMHLPPTRTGSKRAQVTTDLGRRIVLGLYPVESILPPEAALLAEFGVSLSRPVLREAIKTLESIGLLESWQQRGVSVMPRDRWNFLDLEDALNEQD